MQFKSVLLATAMVGASLVSAQAESFTMWIRGSDDSFKVVADAYNSTHDDKVEFVPVPGDQMVQKYAAAVAAGNAPDAVSLDLIYTPSFAASGQLEDLTDWATKLPYFDKLAPSHINLGTLDGRIYAVPFWVETSVLVWNKDLFKQAGLDPEKAPASWDEISENARKIRALGDDTYGFYVSGNCGGCMAFLFLPVIWGGGSDVLSADGKTVTLDNPDTRAAVDAWRKLVGDGVVPESAATDNGTNFMMFTSGKIGVGLLGASSLANMGKKYPDLHFGATLIPGARGNTASFAGGDNFVVTKGTPKLKQIEAFLEWTFSPEGQKAIVGYGSLPSRGDIAADIMKDFDPILSVGADAVAVSHTPKSIKYNDLFNSANGPWASFTNAAIFGDDVDGAFATATQEMTDIINQ